MMSSPLSSVTVERDTGHDFDVLREPATGSEAWIVPSIGANCVRFVSTVGGVPLEVIGMPADWDAFRARPTFYGAAILAPFPGRIREGRFPFLGEVYQLPINEPEPGNAIHGCVCRRPWRKVGVTADAGGASVRYVIAADEQRDLEDEYPFPFRLTVTIRLQGGRLRHEFVVENLGRAPMPFGLGLHPYVPLPLGGVGRVDDHEIWIDAPYFWEQSGHVPVGTARPVNEAVDLRAPRSLRALASVGIGGPERMLNFVHSQFAHDRPPDPGSVGVRAGVRHPALGRGVVVEADAAFPAIVSYIPPSHDKVSFEPHTCLPNAFNLQEEGRVAGSVVLGPGGFWRGTTTIYAEDLAPKT